MRRSCSIALILAGSFGCGLSVVGAGSPIDESPDGASRSEPAAGDSGIVSSDERGDGGAIPLPPPPPCKADACALPQAPSPFSPVLYGDRSDACPAGFATTDVVAEPSATAGACGCGACVMTATCDTGTITSGYSNDGSCSAPGPSIQANGGGCAESTGTCQGKRCSVFAPPAVTTCSAPAVSVRANVTSPQKRLCAPEIDSCAPQMCAPPSSMAACLTAPGDVACPASAPTKHLVGADFELACGACTCKNTATCTGSMQFYTTDNCTGDSQTYEVGECTQPLADVQYHSTKWTGTVVPGQCTNLAPGAATVTLAQTRTICCP